MGVEDVSTNPMYVCPTCQVAHEANPPDVGLNVCVSGSQLHEFHYPKDESIHVPPDKIHVDWITVPGATVDTLCDAWRLDYSKAKRPMRIMLVAGLNDLLKGGDKHSFIEAVEAFKINIDAQNKYHTTSGGKMNFVWPR